MKFRLTIILAILLGFQSTCFGIEKFKCSIDYFQWIDKAKGINEMSVSSIKDQYYVDYYITIDQEAAIVHFKASTTPTIDKTFTIIGTKYDNGSIKYELLDEDQMPLSLDIRNGVGVYPRLNLTFGPVLQVFGKHEPYDKEFRNYIYSKDVQTFVSFRCFLEEDYIDE